MSNDFSKYILFLASLFFGYSNASPQAQTDIKLPVFRQVSYPFLPTITSDYFFFSKDGLMWFSTARGLTSFDGSGIVLNSNFKETADYGFNFIHSIAEDENHNLFIAASRGLIFFNRKRKQFIPIRYKSKSTNEFSSILATSFFVDHDGTVYIGTGSNGLYTYYPATGEIEHYNLDVSQPDKWDNRVENTITCFLPFPGNNSRLWVGTFNGIFSFDKTKKIFSKNFTVVNPQHNLLGQPRIYYDVQKMDMANDTTIWFNIWSGGFAEYNTLTGKCFIYTQKRHPTLKKDIPSYLIPSFAKMDDSLYLLGITNRKPAVFNILDKTLHFFSVTTDTKTVDQIKYMERDVNGNIWLIRNGMLYISMPDYSMLQSTELTHYDSNDYEEELRGIYFDTAQKKYYCAVRMSTGVYVFDTNFNFIRIIPTPLFTNYYTYKKTCTDKIAKDGRGCYWTTGRETYVMPPGTSKFEHVGKIFPTLSWIEKKEEFIDMTTTAKGNILLKESGTGDVFMIDQKTLQTDTFRTPQFKSGSVNEIVESKLSYDAVRNLVYLANEKGIAQYDFDKKIVREICPAAIFGTPGPEQVILRTSIDNEGRLWLLKDKYGIRIIDPKTLSCVDSIPFGTRGFMQAYFNDMDFGGPGRMFFKSLNGVVIYDYTKNQSFLFDNSNGLRYPQVFSMLYSNSHLVIGMHKTINYYDLRKLAKNNFLPKSRVSTITADSTIVYTGENVISNVISFLPGQNTLLFSFSAPEFIFPERIEYAYMLEGVNTQWQYSGYFNRNVTYNNLSPGKYIFHLKAQMQESDWNRPDARYTIIIQPSWWQTMVFKILLIIAACVGIYLFVLWRIKSVRRQEKVKGNYEKELLELEAKALRAQMNPHFIFNCMNSIKSLIQKRDHERAITYLTTFSKLIRTIFQNSDKREINLYDELETCRLYTKLESMRFGNKFSYHFNVDESLDLKSVQVPALIIQPFIENAIWHGIMPKEEAGTVSVIIEKIDNIIYCIIDDDGIGRDVSNQIKFKSGSAAHESKGIKLTQSRLDLDNLLNERKASVEIIDKKDSRGISAGTKIVVHLTEY